MSELILAAGATIDYVALVDPDTLAAVEQITGPTLALLAVKIDSTRLIDNATIGTAVRMRFSTCLGTARNDSVKNLSYALEP